MKKLTSTLIFFVFTSFACVGQYGISYFNSIEKHGSYPVEILQIDEDRTIFLTWTKACGELVVHEIMNDSVGQAFTNYGTIDRYRLKKYGDKWMCGVEQSFVEFLPGPIFSFIHEEDNDLIFKIVNDHMLIDTAIYNYVDFTFISDSSLISIPYKIFYNGGFEYPDFDYWYILDFDGIKVDSISKPLDEIKTIDRMENGYVCTDMDSMYFLDHDFNLMDALELPAVTDVYVVNDSLIVAKNDLEIHAINPNTNVVTTILQGNNETVLDVHIGLDGVPYILELSQKGEGERKVYELSADMNLISIISLNESPIDYYQLAGDRDDMLLVGMDNQDFFTSEFHRFRSNGMTNDREDVSITAYIDSIQVKPVSFLPYYDLTLHFKYDIINHSTKVIDSLKVYSTTIIDYFCEQYHHKIINGPIEPNESIIIEGQSFYLGSVNDFEFCLYVPTINGKPDLNPEDNNSCNYVLNSSDPQIFDQVKLSPNPVVDQLQIESDLEIKEIILFDGSGKRMFNSYNTNQLDMSEMMPGTYYMILQSENQGYAVKQVIKI